MRHAALLAASLFATGLLLTSCQASSINVAALGPMDCHAGTEAACAVPSGDQADRDSLYAPLVRQDVQAILDGMRRVE